MRHILPILLLLTLSFPAHAMEERERKIFELLGYYEYALAYQRLCTMNGELVGNAPLNANLALVVAAYERDVASRGVAPEKAAAYVAKRQERLHWEYESLLKTENNCLWDMYGEDGHDFLQEFSNATPEDVQKKLDGF